MMDEPIFFPSRRTDAESYADAVIGPLSGIIAPLSVRRQGYIRDELIDAFQEGEHNEKLRALTILRIARERTRDPAIYALLEELAYLLAPDLRPDA